MIFTVAGGRGTGWPRYRAENGRNGAVERRRDRVKRRRGTTRGLPVGPWAGGTARVGGRDDSSVSRILSPTRLDGPCRRGAQTAAAAAASQESVLVRPRGGDGRAGRGARRRR